MTNESKLSPESSVDAGTMRDLECTIKEVAKGSCERHGYTESETDDFTCDLTSRILLKLKDPEVIARINRMPGWFRKFCTRTAGLLRSENRRSERKWRRNVALRVQEHYTSQSPEHIRIMIDEWLESLDGKHRQIAELLAQHKDLDEISDAIGMSYRQVQRYKADLAKDFEEFLFSRSVK